MIRKTMDDINKKFQAKLVKPLRFGDPEQIAIMREWRREIDRFEEEEEARNNPGTLIRWRVRYSWREDDEEYVEAATAEEAEEKIEEIYGCRDDFQIEWSEGVPGRKLA